MTIPDCRTFVLALALAIAPAGLCYGQDSAGTAAARFQSLDANQDGVLSKYEYDADAALATLDTDGNGRISAAELQGILGSEEQGAVSAADRIVSSDLDKDGELSDDELRRSLQFRFQWLDKNSDGNVDMAEMKNGLGVPMVGQK